MITLTLTETEALNLERLAHYGWTGPEGISYAFSREPAYLDQKATQHAGQTGAQVIADIESVLAKLATATEEAPVNAEGNTA